MVLPRSLLGSATTALVDVHDMKKQGEEATGSELVSSIPRELMLQFLLPDLYSNIPPDKSVTQLESC